jgi:hypothetical protein
MPMRERAAVNIANSIRMKRSQNPSTTYLLVEGKDDKAFFGRYTLSSGCNIRTSCRFRGLPGAGRRS